VLAENNAMIRLFEKMGFEVQKRREQGISMIRMKLVEGDG
jgi:RimJ/RimL family protein N-acetyltransferase